MASLYPHAFDELANPSPSDRTSAPVSHAGLHEDANNAIEAIQRTLGLNPEGDDQTVADRLGDVTDITDLPDGLTETADGDELLVVQDGGLVLRDASDVLDRNNHIGSTPFLNLRNSANQGIPNNTWTPISFNTVDIDNGFAALASASTTVASGSNGASLPQSTINVASTTGFASAGSLIVTLSGSVPMLVQYTGKTSTTFTGCTLGAGSLATGQTVIQGNTDFTPTTGGRYLVTATGSFASNGTGIRGVRIAVTYAPGFQLFFGMNLVSALSVADQSVSTSSIIDLTNAYAIHVQLYQSSGSTLITTSYGVNSPRIQAHWLGVV